MKQEFLPLVWKGNVTHRLKRYQVPTNVSLNSTNVQYDVSRVLAILEPRVVDFFVVNFMKPIRVKEFLPSNLFPMNSALCFPFVLIIMAYQSNDQF